MNYVFVPPSTDEYNGVSVKGKPSGIEFSDADIRRGYSLAKKQLGLAYLIESVIITACLFAGWQFAERYASGGEPVQFWLAGWTGLQHSQAWWSAILGSCTIAAAELALCASGTSRGKALLPWFRPHGHRPCPRRHGSCHGEIPGAGRRTAILSTTARNPGNAWRWKKGAGRCRSGQIQSRRHGRRKYAD